MATRRAQGSIGEIPIFAPEARSALSHLPPRDSASEPQADNGSGGASACYVASVRPRSPLFTETVCHLGADGLNMSDRSASHICVERTNSLPSRLTSPISGATVERPYLVALQEALCSIGYHELSVSRL